MPRPYNGWHLFLRFEFTCQLFSEWSILGMLVLKFTIPRWWWDNFNRNMTLIDCHRTHGVSSWLFPRGILHGDYSRCSTCFHHSCSWQLHVNVPFFSLKTNCTQSWSFLTAAQALEQLFIPHGEKLSVSGRIQEWHDPCCVPNSGQAYMMASVWYAVPILLFLVYSTRTSVSPDLRSCIDISISLFL